MLTAAGAREASIGAQRQRIASKALLQIDEGEASADDLALARRVLAAPNAVAFVQALASPAVNDLFVRDILIFRVE